MIRKKKAAKSTSLKRNKSKTSKGTMLHASKMSMNMKTSKYTNENGDSRATSNRGSRYMASFKKTEAAFGRHIDYNSENFIKGSLPPKCEKPAVKQPLNENMDIITHKRHTVHFNKNSGLASREFNTKLQSYDSDCSEEI